MNYLYCDGGSINNTHAACAWIITDESNKILYANSVYIGAKTSNEAEFTSLIFGMLSALAGGITHLTVIQDSQLVSRQMDGSYQVKAANLKPLHDTAMDLSSKFTSITFKWVPREHPLISRCDGMCDECIDYYKNR